VTVGEILHATMASGWSKKRIAEVEARLGADPVIPATIGVARK
jgi:predicted nucleic acid-binding protein